ncbi:MAG TPA: alpha/beta hydrolase, partial [Acidimicrobiales bacterium]|nr:alpha/beta hydrolase [Acidimicrobiales bacterium]
EPGGETDFVPPVTERMIPTDDGGQIHVIERGQGPPVVLVHGITLSAAVWGNQLHDLAATHRVIAVDQRGHGRSHPGTEPADLARLGADLLTVLEAMDVRDAVVVGHSMGGMVLLRLAADRLEALSERVAGLVLVGTSGGPVSRLPYWAQVAPVVAQMAGGQIRLSHRTGRGLLPSGDLSYLIARRAFGARPDPTQVEMTRAIIDDSAPLVVAELLLDVMSVDLCAHIGEVDLPALVVVGTKDRLLPPWTARRMADALPRAELLTLPGCGHMAMLERPRELTPAIERFSRSLARDEISA